MISQLSAKYQFGAMHTADTTDGKVSNRALLSTESDKVHCLVLPHQSQTIQKKWILDKCRHHDHPWIRFWQDNGKALTVTALGDSVTVIHTLESSHCLTDTESLTHSVTARTRSVCDRTSTNIVTADTDQRLRINERPLTFVDAPKGWVAAKFCVLG